MAEDKRIEKLLHDARKIEPGNYCLYSTEVIYLADLHDNNFVNGSYDMFRIGFLKGQRAEQARQRKAGAK